METGHLIADVPALFIVAGVLGVLMLRVEKRNLRFSAL
jgi:hypothetical protein